jgi:hypothetical protein
MLEQRSNSNGIRLPMDVREGGIEMEVAAVMEEVAEL